jgi:hypothetical protein
MAHVRLERKFGAHDDIWVAHETWFSRVGMNPKDLKLSSTLINNFDASIDSALVASRRWKMKRDEQEDQPPPRNGRQNSRWISQHHDFNVSAQREKRVACKLGRLEVLMV